MNPFQISKQLRYLLQSARWPDTPFKPVFASYSIKVTAGISDADTLGQVGFPYCFIEPGEARADERNPYLIDQTFMLAVGVRVAGDSIGQTALIGGQRTADGSGGSAARGILEIEEEVLKAVARLSSESGINIRCTYRSGLIPAVMQNIGYVVERRYRLEATATVERYYHPPRNLALDVNDLTWTLPPDRFDRFRVVLVRADGTTTPPADQTDGTVVPLAGDLATSVTDAAPAPKAYSVFMAYDEVNTPHSKESRFSDADPALPGTTVST